MATTVGIMGPEGTGPYNVGQFRAKQALRAVLATQNKSVQHRRLKHVLEQNSLNDDVSCYEWRMAGQHYKDLCRRLRLPHPDQNDARFADIDLEDEDVEGGGGSPVSAAAGAAGAAAAPKQQLLQPPVPDIGRDASAASAGSSYYDDEEDVYAMVPGLGDEDYPGFPAEEGPEELPDLSKHYSLLVAVLKEQPELYASLRTKRTSLGVSFARCMKAAIDVQGHPMVKAAGLFAGDAECYELFAQAFGAIIPKIHLSFNPAEGQQVDPPDAASTIPDTLIDPTGEFVVGTQVQVRRNLLQYPTPVAMSLEQRLEVEELLQTALTSCMPGAYASLKSMTEQVAESMQAFGVVFDAPESNLLRSAGFGKQWPHGRGFFAADDRGSFALVNNEEHLQFSSYRKDSNLKATYLDLQQKMEALQSAMGTGVSFATSPGYGFLSTSLEHLGSAMEASVLLELPHLSENPEFRSCAKRKKLVVKREPDIGERIWRIGHAERLGPAASAQITVVVEGVSTLVQLEKRLANGEQVDLSSA
mmetsp:Transcript_25477/g.59323  ORF Transcript_25477/g.59323 Transcript_25477/m.59323 type:complete len:530 (+) Transcript_25477:79-1668(+)